MDNTVHEPLCKHLTGGKDEPNIVFIQINNHVHQYLI